MQATFTPFAADSAHLGGLDSSSRLVVNSCECGFRLDKIKTEMSE